MHESLAVREIESGADLLSAAERVFYGQLPCFVEALTQRSARNMRLDIIEQAGGLTGVNQGNDVRMRQLGGDADFTQEAVRAERRRDFGSQDFDRDFAPVFPFFGKIDRRHSPATQLPLDDVAIAEGGGHRSQLRSTHGAQS